LAGRVRRAPRTLAERGRGHLERYRHALRRRREPAEQLRDARAAGGDLGAAIAAFRSRTPAHFFLGVAQAEETVAFLDGTLDGWRAQLVRDADRILAGKVRPLGADEADLADLRAASAPPDGGRWPWHDDGVNDHRWSDRRFHKQVPMEVDRADLKIPWELSRCQQLPTLGMAYRATGEEEYSAEVVRTIDDWIERNPLGYGVNWVTSMEVAIRAVNWLWAYELIAPSRHVSDDFVVRLLASLVEHGRHIAGNLEIYAGGVTTNHTLADYAGLAHLGLCLPELRDAEAWTRTGLDGLAECMRGHVHPDGGHFENSVAYHRLVLEMLLASHVLAERAGRPFPADYRDSLERMVEFVLHHTRPDGLAPLVGDSDDGRFHVLARYFDWEPQDHRYLLALGGALFGRDDLVAAGRAGRGAIEEVAWLLGADAARGVAAASGAPEPPGSRAFADSGRYVMRSAAAYVLVCADEAGTYGVGNHKHNDILGFELALRGEPVVVDRGTFAYQGDVAWRDRFRSTRSHSTVAVDGVEQNEMRGTFWMPPDARVTVEDWRDEPDRDALVGRHTGYERLPDPVAHTRAIVLEREPFALAVLDLVVGAAEHDAESAIQLDPRGQAAPGPVPAEAAARAAAAVARLAGRREGLPPLELDTDAAAIYSGESVRVAIVPFNADRLAVESGWHAPRYGRRVPAPVVRISARTAGRHAFGYVIVDADA
jgi:Heparinase II/III N-terminus/Heparinase II/III-like protein